MSEVVIIFTCKSLKDILAIGGTGWWRVDAARVRHAGRVVVVHNAHDGRKPGDPEKHGHPFLYATVRQVRQDDDGRWLIQFDKYAETGGEFRWPGFRNPVVYMDGDELLPQLEIGDWQEMPEIAFEEAQRTREQWDEEHGHKGTPGMPKEAGALPKTGSSFGEVIARHRGRLAEDLGVDPEKVRIVIEA
ncbi:hypothetical protein [Jannaschia sp. W003]|uniref:hypothetical protein n=1 Tax=Jannaschia sp. W003 TaxID=2867012 RepID=UPI0021A93523|nr:hypothetical protein [Jannaschia sp. W003]UWQ20115.1 hypothetical protein K3554_08845 [Jannaschia sp. W003]